MVKTETGRWILELSLREREYEPWEILIKTNSN